MQQLVAFFARKHTLAISTTWDLFLLILLLPVQFSACDELEFPMPIRHLPHKNYQYIQTIINISSYWRKGWDLNPRTAFTAYPLSRRASSTSLSTPPNIMAEKRGFEPPEGYCPLQQISNLPPSTYSATSPYFIGGEGGIRTHGSC